jgi:hypothetical protein
MLVVFVRLTFNGYYYVLRVVSIEFCGNIIVGSRGDV